MFDIMTLLEESRDRFTSSNDNKYVFIFFRNTEISVSLEEKVIALKAIDAKLPLDLSKEDVDLNLQNFIIIALAYKIGFNHGAIMY